MNLPTKISTSGLATLLSVNERTIGKLVDKKVLRREARGVFDLVDAVAAYVAHREAVVAAEQGVGDYGKARTEWMQEKAAAAKIDRIARQGGLVDVNLVRDGMVDLMGVVRKFFLGVPAKLAPRLAGMKSVPEMHDALSREVRQILTEISDVAVRSRIRRATRIKREQRLDKGDDDDAAA